MNLNEPNQWTRLHYSWPDELPDAPDELIDIIQKAMIDFGPDGHCDGADKIAAIALDWIRRNIR